MKNKSEFLACISIFILLLTILDIAIIKDMKETIKVHSVTFIEAGMMEYVNPVDNKVLYIPIYTKR